jgi:hypothetical protein
MSVEGKIYKNQTGLLYRMYTYQDVSTLNQAFVKWRKPDGTSSNSYLTGLWAANIESAATAELGIISVGFLGRGTAWDQSGRWKLWSYVNFVGGGSAPGEAIEEIVYEEGE